MIDLPAVIEATRRALPGSQPFASVPLFVEQVRWLDQEAGIDLVERLTASTPLVAWQLSDTLLDSWPPAVAARAMDAVRALPPSEDRIEALCLLPQRLAPAEQDEALAALLDGSFPEQTWRYTKPESRRDTITAFVRTLPAEAREVWVRARAVRDAYDPVLCEYVDRRSVECLPEAALRDLWARVAHTSNSRPLHGFGLASALPADLRGEALARIRACTDLSSRLHHLVHFDEELTDAERTELVEVPSNPHIRVDPHHQVRFHLKTVARHLPKVAPEVRRRWLDVMLAIEANYERQVGLLALLPSLDGADRDRAVGAIVRVLEEDGSFHAEERWDLLPDDALPAYLLRLREDPYAWHRDGLVEHILTERSAAAADRILPIVLQELDSRPSETVLEIVRSLTPWLADRTRGAAPRSIASLPIPTSTEWPNAQYNIARVLRNEPLP